MALNQQSENSVMADPASNKVVPDGTGEELEPFSKTSLTCHRRG